MIWSQSKDSYGKWGKGPCLFSLLLNCSIHQFSPIGFTAFFHSFFSNSKPWGFRVRGLGFCWPMFFHYPHCLVCFFLLLFSITLTVQCISLGRGEYRGQSFGEMVIRKEESSAYWVKEEALNERKASSCCKNVPSPDRKRRHFSSSSWLLT